MTQRTDERRPQHTVPGVGRDHAAETIEHLHGRLASTIDLELTLKHVHWNVVGRNFISVHQMLDDFTMAARAMVDEIAERIRALGGVPLGRPGDVVARREWEDYALEAADSIDHLCELDRVYDGIILDHRRAMVHVANLDRVTEDLLIAQTAVLEQHQWFIRSFLYDVSSGEAGTEGHERTTGDGRRTASAGTGHR